MVIAQILLGTTRKIWLPWLATNFFEVSVVCYHHLIILPSNFFVKRVFYRSPLQNWLLPMQLGIIYIILKSQNKKHMQKCLQLLPIIWHVFWLLSTYLRLPNPFIQSYVSNIDVILLNTCELACLHAKCMDGNITKNHVHTNSCVYNLSPFCNYCFNVFFGNMVRIIYNCIFNYNMTLSCKWNFDLWLNY